MQDDSQVWDQYHKKTHQEEEGHSTYAEEKEKLFPRNCIIADLGGGTGGDALFFLQKGHRVVLFDISSFALKLAEQKAKAYSLSHNLITRQVDFGLHPLPLNENSVDVVYSRIALNYFPQDQTMKIFDSVRRCLKQGGSAYLSFKSPDDTNEMESLRSTAVQYEPNVYIENGQLRSRFTKEQLEGMLKAIGITSYKVTPHSESLQKPTETHHPQLLVNDIYFTK